MSLDPILFDLSIPEIITIDIIHIALLCLLILSILFSSLLRCKRTSKTTSSNTSKVSKRVEELSQVIAEEREELHRAQSSVQDSLPQDSVIPSQLQPAEAQIVAAATITEAAATTTEAQAVVASSGTVDKSVEGQNQDVDVEASNASAPALQLLSLLQQEARLVDFFHESLTGFSDADIGAAARVVHEGGKKVLDQYFTFESIRPEEEESTISLPVGFPVSDIRLTGNVIGEAPYTGTLLHKGWKVTQVNLPTLTDGYKAEIVMAAEVEL